MKTAMGKIALLVALATPVMFAAQEARPQARPGGPPPRRGALGEGMPQMPDPSGFFQAQAMRAIDEKGSLLLEMGKTAEAIQALQEVYTLDVPKQSPMYELKVHVIGSLAKAYLAAGQKGQALETIRKVLAEVSAGSPAEAAAWLEAGGVYKKAGMPEEALKAFDRSIDLSKKLAAGGWAPPSPPSGPGNPHSGPGGPPPGGEHR
jgi:tetratricopeptide (TPR) repeat protein